MVAAERVDPVIRSSRYCVSTCVLILFFCFLLVQLQWQICWCSSALCSEDTEVIIRCSSALCSEDPED